jgi:hypothetical protein
MYPEAVTWTKLITGVAAVVALTSLVAGIWVGLNRIGWVLGSPPAPGSHGLILVLGFLGTVIGLERAVAIDRAWAWASPLCAAGASAGILLGAPDELVGLLLVLGGGVLVGVFGVAYRVQPETHILVMGMGAVAWVLAATTWLTGMSVAALIPWLSAFLVLTIAGERLELARMIATTDPEKRRLVAAIAFVVVGSLVAWMAPETGARIAGFGNLLVALWLIRYDIARRTVRLGGITTYMASALLMGYGWLAVSGTLWMVSGLRSWSIAYDAALHTLFLGFVMSMIMAHAPIIIPALTGLSFPFTSALWIPLAMLQVTVTMRVVGGLLELWELRRWGAMLNALALALFVAMVVASVVRGELLRRQDAAAVA